MIHTYTFTVPVDQTSRNAPWFIRVDSTSSLEKNMVMLDITLSSGSLECSNITPAQADELAARLVAAAARARLADAEFNF